MVNVIGTSFVLIPIFLCSFLNTQSSVLYLRPPFTAILCMVIFLSDKISLPKFFLLIALNLHAQGLETSKLPFLRYIESRFLTFLFEHTESPRAATARSRLLVTAAACSNVTSDCLTRPVFQILAQRV
jgi:hypothetical protein